MLRAAERIARSSKHLMQLCSDRAAASCGGAVRGCQPQQHEAAHGGQEMALMLLAVSCKTSLVAVSWLGPKARMLLKQAHMTKGAAFGRGLCHAWSKRLQRAVASKHRLWSEQRRGTACAIITHASTRACSAHSFKA
jgi:hypothetical protein